jgi:uracil-DNA glycosylase
MHRSIAGDREMTHPFDPGYGHEPFQTLCTDYPGVDVYPPTRFRVEWGPIFHRGRLDGSARVVVIGQDPAQHETIVRRILVGEAGRRLQGFLAKLGITRSYVLLNTFLYSVYGSVTVAARKHPALIAYRHRWLDALFAGQQIEAVVTLGTLAAEAWQLWKETPQGQATTVAVASITHPTQPESASKGNKTKLAAAITAMLQNWNAGLQHLAPALQHPDRVTALVLYGEAFQDGDRLPIPAQDLPGRAARLDARAGGVGRTRGYRRTEKARQYYHHCAQRGSAMTMRRRTATRATQPQPIDPLSGPPLALAGRVVQMDADFHVIEDGVVYIDHGGIVAVCPRTQPAPTGFQTVPIHHTRGMLFPSLIELHNHMSYNALRLWQVPKMFANRERWAGIAEYRKQLSGPMQVIGRTPALLSALVRYVECKCLLGG